MLRRPVAKVPCLTARTFAMLLAMLTLAAQFTLVAPAAAEEPTAFTNVLLWVYPEYDDPRLLVMLEGSLSQGATVPSTVRFLVPSGAEMYLAGSVKDGKLVDARTTRKESGIPGWDELSFDLVTGVFRVEYYHDTITGLPNKSIAYEFRSLYPIDSLEAAILQPAKATGFSATPPPQGRGTDRNLTVHNHRFTNIEVDKPLAFDISYTKPDSNPSINPQTGSAATPNLDRTFVWMFGLGAAALAMGAAVWYSSIRRRVRLAPRPHSSTPVLPGRTARGLGQHPAPRLDSSARLVPARTAISRARPDTDRRDRAEKGASAKGAFCRKCGTPLEVLPGRTRFCSHCGTPIG